MSPGDFLKDPVYEQMGWLEKAVNLYQWKALDVFNELPDETIVPDDCIRRLIFNSSMAIHEMMYMTFGVETTEALLSLIHAYSMAPPFQLIISDDFVYDRTTDVIESGCIILKKQPIDQSNEALRNALANITVGAKLYLKRESRGGIERAREIVDLLDQQYSNRRIRDTNTLIKIIHWDIIGENIKSGNWNIRSFELVQKLYKWVMDYITLGTLHSFVNITKFKLATHTGDPIYAIEEAV